MPGNAIAVPLDTDSKRFMLSIDATACAQPSR
jgi:hypothetical protein